MCGAIADVVGERSISENGRGHMPLPAQKKSINIELPEMIIRNANPKSRGEKPHDVAPIKPLTARKFLGNLMNILVLFSIIFLWECCLVF